MLRRYRIKKNEYEQVLKWVQKQKHDEQEDEKSPEPLAMVGHTMPADWLPKITWAHKTKLRVQVLAHGKHGLEVQDGTTWKRLLHEHNIDAYLREQLLSAAADVPLSRDAGYHIVQQRTIGISRRKFAKFIAKQAVLQITRDRTAKQEKRGRVLQKRGLVELDLVEAKGTDIGIHVHHPVSNFYWITMIDRLTGWLEVKRSNNKKVKTIAPKIQKMLKNMAKALQTPVVHVRSDRGSEFKAETQDVFKVLNVKHSFVSSGNRIEQANKTWQKTWYRLMRLGRGDLTELDVQAQAIFNNTVSGITGKTPLEALETNDKVLTEKYGEYHKRKHLAKYKAVNIDVGDRVRYILKTVTGKHGKALAYKSYRGKHWSMTTYVVVKKTDNVHQGLKFYVNGKYRFRDELLKVPGVDLLTRARVVEKHRRHKKDYVDEIVAAGHGADLALGDPEEDQPS